MIEPVGLKLNINNNLKPVEVPHFKGDVKALSSKLDSFEKSQITKAQNHQDK